jgi:hypothetical protein
MCALRGDITKRSNLHSTEDQRIRSFVVKDDQGQVVGGCTLRCNCWYLAEIKYIFAENRKVFDMLLQHVVDLGRRPVYQVTVAKGELVLRNALKAAGFEKAVSFTYKGRTPELWGMAVDYVTPRNEVDSTSSAGSLNYSESVDSDVDDSDSEPVDPDPDSEPDVEPVDSQYSMSSVEVRGKLHRHDGFSWHAVSIKHTS